jgi:membrane glycosyltransferase
VALLSMRSVNPDLSSTAWVPGPVIGGVAMISGSMLWLTAVVLRLVAREVAEFTPEQLGYFDSQTFRAPHQLAVYQQNPALLTAGYALFAAASVLLVPALLSLAKIIAAGSPVLAMVGGTSATLSLLARMYFSGVDLSAFELVDALGLEAATAFVRDAYVDPLRSEAAIRERG